MRRGVPPETVGQQPTDSSDCDFDSGFLERDFGQELLLANFCSFPVMFKPSLDGVERNRCDEEAHVQFDLRDFSQRTTPESLLQSAPLKPRKEIDENALAFVQF